MKRKFSARLIGGMFLIVFALSACIIVNENSNVVKVDGVELKYENQITISQAYDYDELMLDIGSGEINLNGRQSNQVELTISYFEFEPEDASLSLVDGGIKTSSKTNKPVLIRNITGNIPQNLKLEIDTGSGDLKIIGLKNSPLLSLDTGSGNVKVYESQIKRLVADTGSGDIMISKCQIENLVADTGSGNLVMHDSKINLARANTGSGDIMLQDCEIGQREFSTGSGGVIERSGDGGQKGPTPQAY